MGMHPFPGLMERIRDAHIGIRPQVPVSPLERSRVLSERARKTGVITASTGNHGQAVARAGKLAGVAVTVYLGTGAPKAKKDAIRAFGAELIELDVEPLGAELEARRQSELQGKPFVAPYNDLNTV